jgi:DNA-binding NarL/FixJ family response regulator
MIRLLIADDHRIFLQGLRRLLADHQDLTVVAEARNYAEVMNAVRHHELDVAVLDLSMPGRDGVEMISHVKVMKPSLKTLIMTMHMEEPWVTRALRAGTDAYMIKDNAAEQLVEVIRRVARGERYVCPEVAERIALSLPFDGDGLASHKRLTDREYKVFELLIAGKRGSDIARVLSLSAKTVSSHKAHLLRKMKMNNCTELVRYAIKHQLLDA